MKKVTLLCVGKIKEKYLSEGIADYCARLKRFCDFTVMEIADKPDLPEAVKEESDVLLSKIKGYCILFDIGGELFTSEELAKKMDGAFVRSPEITFVIGGSRGVDARVRDRADIRISFGRTTFPHMLMRLMAAEQIYRCLNILGGTPYHK